MQHFMQYKTKNALKLIDFVLNMAVRGIRTPDTLPYTHFPGVLLQPLGHLTILSCCSPWVGNGALL